MGASKQSSVGLQTRTWNVHDGCLWTLLNLYRLHLTVYILLILSKSGIESETSINTDKPETYFINFNKTSSSYFFSFISFYDGRPQSKKKFGRQDQLSVFDLAGMPATAGNLATMYFFLSMKFFRDLTTKKSKKVSGYNYLYYLYLSCIQVASFFWLLYKISQV